MLLMILGRSRSKSVETPYSFQERFQEIQRIAIIYPERTEWVRIARYTLQKLFSFSERFEYMIFLPDHALRPALDVSHEYVDMTYHPDAEQKRIFLSQIIGFNPQLLLQLEPSPSIKLEKSIAELNLGLKIGFGTERSSLNVIYSPKPTGFYEKNLLNIISLLEVKR